MKAESSSRYRLLGLVLMGIASVLLVLAVAQEFFGAAVFSEPPFIVAAGVGAIGVALASGARKRE